MQATLDTTTGRYAVKAVVRMTGEFSEKAQTLITEGVLSKALYRGCFPDCRKLIAGIDPAGKDDKGKKLKVADDFDVLWMDKEQTVPRKFDLTVAGKIRTLAEEKLTTTCDGVVSVEVTEYVPGESTGGGTKRTEESLRQLIRLGVMKPMGEVELKALAVSMKESK